MPVSVPVVPVIEPPVRWTAPTTLLKVVRRSSPPLTVIGAAATNWFVVPRIRAPAETTVPPV